MMTTNPSNTPLDNMWAAVRRRRALAALLFLSAFALIAGVVTSLPDLYRASASVLINPGSVPDSFIRSPVSSELEPRLFAVSQEVMSRDNLQRLIDEHGLYPDMRDASQTARVERMRRDISIERQRVEVAWGQGTTIAFDVTYHGFDRDTAAAVANELATLFVSENDRLRERQAVATASFLKAQLDEVQGRLDRQEQAINGYRESRLGELPEQQAANLATLERLHAQLRMNSENQLRVMERRSELVRRMEGTSSGESHLAELQAELASLRARVSDRHPDVVRLRAEIDALSRSGASQVQRGTADQRQRLAQYDDELEALRREESRLRQSTNVYEERIENVPRREAELAALTRDYNATREQYGSLLARYEEALVAESLERGTDAQFRLLDAAVPPDNPAGPPRMRLLIMGFVFSLMLAAGGIVLAEQLDQSFHSVDELKDFTNVPVLAGIPRIITMGDVARGWARGGASVAGVVALVAVLVVAGYALGTGNNDLVMMMARRGA